jgi:cytochrome P450
MTADPNVVQPPRAETREAADRQASSAVSLMMRRLTKRVTLWLMTHPGVTRFLLRGLGRFSPVIVFGRRVIVTGHGEICSVMGRDADFTLGPNAPSAIIDGPFVLRMERGPQYLREIEVLRHVVRPGDLGRVSDIAKAEAERRVGELKGGRVDVVADIAVPVGLAMITEYLGAPAPLPDGLVLWLRCLAGFIVLSGFGDPLDEAEAKKAAAALRRYVESLMADWRPAAGDAGNDVLSRLMTMAKRGEVDEDLVRRSFTGLLIVSHAVVVNGMALAVDELLRRSDALSALRQVAQAGNSKAMTGYAFEALRFSPVFPLLGRFSPRPTELVDRAGKGHSIPAGAAVFIGAIAGMCDASVFDRPTDFDPTRPLQNYFIFGSGTHSCFGQHIAATEMPQMLIALFKLRNLRRAPADLGRLRYEGPAAVRLLLDFQEGTA